MIAWAVIAVLLPVTYTDIRDRRIPNVIVLVGLAAGLALRIWQGSLLAGVEGALFLGGPFLLLWLFRRKDAGAGDVKLMTVAGLFLGLPLGRLALIGTGLAALLFAVGQAVVKRKLDLGNHVPVAPFLLAGTMAALLWGGRLL
ncbi:MAG: A24 family peptidase [Peptococcaceae bacterium]|jgi:Flp pilus assembly protein protease CpaA|nr:A24 family peptidase [Peptococcaceae bacterium]